MGLDFTHAMITKMFDAIVVTSSSEKQSRAFQGELELRKSRGAIPSETLVLSVSSPGDYFVEVSKCNMIS